MYNLGFGSSSPYGAAAPQQLLDGPSAYTNPSSSPGGAPAGPAPSYGGTAPNAAPAGNPYLNQSISDALGDSTRQYNLTTAPAYTSAMVRSGSFGNSGLQQMQDESQRQLMTAQGRQANDMRSQNYQFDQNMDRGIYNDTFGQNQQNFQNGMQVLGMQNQSNQQNLGFGTQIQNTPMNYYQGFSQTANGIGNGFGTSSGTSTAQGSAMMGALGGAQLGSALGKQFSMGSTPTVTDGGYSSGQGAAYGGSYYDGQFTPSRAGM